MVEYIILNRDDIGALTGGGDPGYNSAIDTRWLLLETGGVADAYVAALTNAAGNALVEGFSYWLHGQLITTTGTVPATLNVGTIEGNVPLKKKTESGIVDLQAGDMPLFGAFIYYSAKETAWLLINPTNTGITHTTGTVVPDDSFGNEGDLFYIEE